MHRAVGAAVAEEPGHTHGIRIVMFQPLLAAERIAHRRTQSVRQLDHFFACIPASIAAENRHRSGFIDHLRQPTHIAVRRPKDRRAGNPALERAGGRGC